MGITRRRRSPPPRPPPASRQRSQSGLSRPVVLLALLVLLIYTFAPRHNRSQLSIELSKPVARYFVDSDLYLGNPAPELTDLRLTQSHRHTLILASRTHDALSVRLPLPCTTPPQTAKPSLVQLTHALGLHNVTLPAWEVDLPLKRLKEVSDRSTSRAVLRACGYKSSLQAQDVSVTAIVILQVEPMRNPKTLNASAATAYDWHMLQPSATECHEAVAYGPKEMQNHCKRLLEMLLVAYVGGCAPPSDTDIFQAGSETALGLPKSCFAESAAWKVSRDILLVYLHSMCTLPKGLIARIRSLRSISWGVGRRVELLIREVDRKEVCTSRWHFY